MKPIYAEHSSWAGLGLIANGIAYLIVKDYQNAAINIIGGIAAIVKRENPQ